MIHWELCKKFQFDHTNKWYMHNLTSALKNDIQTYHLISSRQPDIIIIIISKKKGTCKIVDFAIPADHWVNLKESEKKEKYVNFAWRIVETIEHESDVYTNCINYCIIEIEQNTNRSPGDLRRLAVAKNPVRNHQQTLM